MTRIFFLIIAFQIFNNNINAMYTKAPEHVDEEHLVNIATTLRGPERFAPRDINNISNSYQVSTYFMLGTSKENREIAYLWVSQDYLLSAANLAKGKSGIRVKSYTISTSLVDANNNQIGGVSIIESSPYTTDPTHTVTSSITLPMSLNATFPSGGGITSGIMPGWQRSFSAPSTRVKKECGVSTVNWVYEIHRKSPVAISDFDPSHKWIWKIENLSQHPMLRLHCTLDVEYKRRKRKQCRL